MSIRVKIRTCIRHILGSTFIKDKDIIAKITERMSFCLCVGFTSKNVGNANKGVEVIHRSN